MTAGTDASIETRRAAKPSASPAPGRAAAAAAADAVALPHLAEAARVRLGASADTRPDVLHGLALDPSVTVRAAVAMNRATPQQADLLLAGDHDERVRTLLARKLALLIPNLPPIQRGMLEQHVLTMLARLVEDEAVRVRAAIADAVKDMAAAPRELILRLARDSALPVSEPVIRLSPLLTTDDLLALLADAPLLATALARRPSLPEAVADALAGSADAPAITALLANRSAAIREATLDTLSQRAVAHTEWHEPLVRRPVLSVRAARALAEIVTTQLLGVLTSRGDLDPEVTRELRQRLAARYAPMSAVPEPTLDDAVAHARALFAAGRLDEAVLAAAAQQGEAGQCAALLAVAASVPVAMVQRAITLHTAKGLVSLIWKAGFSMRVAVPLQVLLCRLDPAAVLRGDQSGSFPLAVEEMRWQLDFLARVGR